MWHPFLASAPDSFQRLVRAYLWSILDSDFTHSQYWFAQVAQAKEAFCQDLFAKNTIRPVSLETLRTLERNAMTSAFEMCAKRHRQSVSMPQSVSFARVGRFYGKTYTKGQGVERTERRLRG